MSFGKVSYAVSATGAAFLAGVLLLHGGASAQEPGDITVDVAIDVDVAGNGDTTLGPTESCNATPLQVGDTIDVDVVVRGIPAYDPNNQPTGTGGWEVRIRFDPAVLQLNLIHAYDGPTLLDAGPSGDTRLAFRAYNGPLFGDEPPGTGGRSAFAMLNLFGKEIVGTSGVMTRLTFEAVGQGATRLHAFAYSKASAPPQIYNPTGEHEYTVRASDATVVVGIGSCDDPTPTFVPTPTPIPTPARTSTPTATLASTPTPTIPPEAGDHGGVSAGGSLAQPTPASLPRGGASPEGVRAAWPVTLTGALLIASAAAAFLVARRRV
jgi:hypothetical protein